MLQQETPDDYVVATNELYSVRDFCKKTFSQLGLNYEDHVEIDPRYYRPAEVELLLGDSTKACEQLGWKPETSFDQLVTMMVENDMRLAQQELILKGKSFVAAKLHEEGCPLASLPGKVKRQFLYCLS